MASPQTGIFALGTSSHAYLEFDLLGRRPTRRRRSRSWRASASRGRRSAASTSSPASGRSSGRRSPPMPRRPGVTGFNEPVVGPSGYALPATQHDVVIWLTGARLRRRLRPVSRRSCPRCVPHALARARDGRLAVPPRPRPDRLHRRHREPDARRGDDDRGRSRRAHPARAARSSCSSNGSTTPRPGRASPESEQEAAIGRRKADSVELDPARRRRMWPAPTRIASARSSAGTSRTAPWAGTARSSSASARISESSRAMLDSMVGREAARPTSSPSSPGRSPAPTTSSPRRNASPRSARTGPRTDQPKSRRRIRRCPPSSSAPRSRGR